MSDQRPSGPPDTAAAAQAMKQLADQVHAAAWTAAEAGARDFIAHWPDRVFGWSVLGTVLQQLGRHTAARDALVQATTLAPDDASLHARLGNALRSLGRFDAAIASYQRSLALAPGHAPAHYNLGNAWRSIGRLDEAVASYQRALAIRADHRQAQLNLGNALQELGRFDAAEACYREAARIDPAWHAPHFNQHALRLNHGDVAGAIHCVQAALARDADNLAYHFFLGQLLDYSGQAAAAAGHWQRIEQAGAAGAAAAAPAAERTARARLDAWRYLQSATGSALPTLAGTAWQIFRLGLAAANEHGLVLEFGVRFGRSIRQIASLVDGPVHGFDSFEGLPEAWHHEPQGSYSTRGVLPQVPPQVSLHAGWFEHTLPNFLQQQPGPARFINIDCDLYSSTRTVLDLLAERIVPGTVIVFDEYIGNAHWRDDEFKAFQEAVARHGWAYDYLAFSFATKQVVVRLRAA